MWGERWGGLGSPCTGQNWAMREKAKAETPRAGALGGGDAPESKVRGPAEWTGKEAGWDSGRRGDSGLRQERTEGRGGLPTPLP